MKPSFFPLNPLLNWCWKGTQREGLSDLFLNIQKPAMMLVKPQYVQHIQLADHHYTKSHLLAVASPEELKWSSSPDVQTLTSEYLRLQMGNKRIPDVSATCVLKQISNLTFFPPLNTERDKSLFNFFFYEIDGWTWAVVKGQAISLHGLNPPSAPQISWAQNTLLFPLSPPGTFTLCGYILGGRGRQGRARNQGLRPRSQDKLAKPLRWFQLKLAELPVGSINSELAQTLTSMGGTFPPLAPLSRSPLCLALSLSSLHPFPLHFTSESSN